MQCTAVELSLLHRQAVVVLSGESSTEQTTEALLTVRPISVLLEGALVQLPLTVGADEVLGVELPRHGRDTSARHRPAATVTQ